MTAELPKTTNRQKEVLAFCIEHFTEFDCLPTLQAMADHFLWASIKSSVCHFKALEKRGYLERCGIPTASTATGLRALRRIN